MAKPDDRITRYAEFRIEPLRALQDEDELRLAPVEGKSREELDEQRGHKLPLSDVARSELEKLLKKRRRRRYTLVEVFGLVTIACASLSLSTYLPVHLFAGVLGFSILMALYFLPAAIKETRRFWIAWWTMAAIYLGAVTAAMLRG